MDKFDTPQDHMEWLLESFSNQFKPKYYAGQKRHSGRLWRKNTSSMLIEEVLDFVSYAFTRNYQITQALKLLVEAEAAGDWALVAEARNILHYGNPEGILEEDNA